MRRNDYISKMLRRMQTESPRKLAAEAGYAERALGIVKNLPSPLKEEIFVELILQGLEGHGVEAETRKSKAA